MAGGGQKMGQEKLGGKTHTHRETGGGRSCARTTLDTPFTESQLNVKPQVNETVALEPTGA